MTINSTIRTAEVGGLAFAYDERVLAPRAWTEAQSEWARELLDEVPPGRVLELFSGVGHIGLLALLGNARSLVMVDASETACEYARHNALAAVLHERVEVRVGSLDSALDDDETFPLVIADPPWVPTAEVETYPEDPVLAIDGGADGLGPTLTCLEVVGRHLAPGGACVLQLGSRDQVTRVEALLAEHRSMPLRVTEVRDFPRGILVLLRRRGEDG